MSVNLQNEQLQIYRTRVVRGLEVSACDPHWPYQNVHLQSPNDDH